MDIDNAVDQERVRELLGITYWVHAPGHALASKNNGWDVLNDAALSRRLPFLLHEPLRKLERWAQDEHDRLVLQWRRRIEVDLKLIQLIGFRRIRTNVSMCEWLDSPNGWILQEWYIRRFIAVFNRDGCRGILPNINFTPICLGEPDNHGAIRTNSPPRDLGTLAWCTGELLDRFPGCFEAVMLRNEFNEKTSEWNWDLDPDGSKFCTEIDLAAREAHARGVQVALGGMSKLNDESIRLFRLLISRGVLSHVDIVTQNALRATSSQNRLPEPWDSVTDRISSLIAEETGRNLPVWMTELGIPTTDWREEPFSQENLELIQTAVFAEEVLRMLRCGRPMYWYTLRDSPCSLPTLRMVNSGIEDPTQHFFGMFRVSGRPKLLGKLLARGGVGAVLKFVRENRLGQLADTVIERPPLPKKAAAELPEAA